MVTTQSKRDSSDYCNQKFNVLIRPLNCMSEDISKKLKQRTYEGMNEENVCIRVVIPYIKELLDWDIKDIYGEYKVSSSGKKVDYALGDRVNPDVLVEVKSLGTDLDKNEAQISDYLDLSDTSYGLLTDGINFRLMERVENQDNKIIKQFQITEPIPEHIKKENIEKEYNQGTVSKFAEDIKKNYPASLPNRLIESLILQYHSSIHSNNPIRICLTIEEPLTQVVRNFLLDQYNGINYRKGSGKYGEIVKTTDDPCLIVYDNTKSEDVVSENVIERSFDSVEFDYSTGMPKDVPIIILDNPENGYFGLYEPLTGQMNIEASVLACCDLIYCVSDSQEDEYGIARSRLENQNIKINTSFSLSEDHTDVKDISLNENAIENISNFYEDISRGIDETIPVSEVLISQLENICLVYASIDGSGTVDEEISNRAITTMVESLKDIGYDEDVGEFDITNKKEREKNEMIRDAIVEIVNKNEDVGEEGAPKEFVIKKVINEYDFPEDEIVYHLQKMGREGKRLYQPTGNEYLTF